MFLHVVGGEVGLSNLQRQIIHSTEDVGKAKVESARETLNRLNPHVDIRTYPTFVSASNIMDLIAEYDFIMALTCSLIIAAVTFVISFTGLLLGKKCGTKFSNKATILGGSILIAIGIEIFVSGVF